MKKFLYTRLSSPRRLIIFATTIILVPIVLFSLFKPSKPVASWWDGGWQYRQIVTITNNESSDLTDYPVSITLDTATLISAGKMETDCRDLRFINQGGQELPFWIEENNPGCNNAATKIWVKVPNIPADNGTIAVYYGNPSASQSPKQSGLEVFDFFDDFNSGSDFDATRWSACTGDFSTSISGGELTATRTAVDSDSKLIATAAPDGNNYAMRARAKATTFAVSGDRFGVSIKANSSDSCRGYNYVQGQELTTHRFLDDRVASDASVYDEGVAASTYRTTEIYHNGTNVYGRVNDGTWRSVAWSGRTGYPALNVGAQADVSVTVWDWALVRKITANEPTTAFASEETTPDPVAEWKFDEGQGQTVHDSSKQGNNGTLGATSGSSTDDPTWVAEDQCVSGKCLKFDGSSDFIAIPDDDSLDMSTNFTAQAWVKFNNFYSGSCRSNIVLGKGHDALAGWYAIQIGDTGGCGTATGIYKASASVRWDDLDVSGTTGNLSLSTNTWYHFALVSTNTELKLYINGVLDSSMIFSNRTPGNNSDSLYIGKMNNLYYPYWVNGYIDGVKIYQSARSADQIKADYAAGAAALGATDQSFLSDGLVGYWKMDEASWNGTSGEVKDASGANNNGTRVGNATTGVGKFGSGGTFDGTGDYATVTSSSSLNSATSQITFSSWIYPTSTSDFKTVIGKTFQTQWWFGLYTSSYRLQLWLNIGGTARQMISNNTLVTANQWNHIAATYDGKTVTLYVNGAVDSTWSYSGALGTNSDNLYLGADRQSGSPEYEFIGNIDETRIYNRALSANEVKALYNFAPGPVLHLKMDDAVSGNGQTITDSSTYGNNGTTDDGANDTGMNCTVAGKIGKACQFDGVDDFITLGDPSNGLLDLGINDFTIQSWFKLNQDGYQALITKVNSTTDNGLELRFPGTGIHQLQFLLDDSGSYDVNSTTLLRDNNWHFASAVRNGDNLSLYIDGILEDTISGVDSVDISGSESFNIGRRETAAAGYLLGSIDNIKIYNYARTEAQIQQDMMAVGDSIQASSVLPQPIAHWGFDEQASQTVVDRISSNNGTLGADSGASTDDPTWKTKKDCKINGCLSFDGGDYVNISSAFDTLSTNVTSVTAWVKINSYDTFGAVLFGTSTGNDVYWQIYSDNQVYVASMSININQTNFDDGQWRHIAFTSNGSKISMYVNGSLVGSTNTVGTAFSSGAKTFRIGSWDFGGSWDLNGSLDEVKIYNTALTASQVAQDYAAGSSVVFGTTASSEAADLTDGEGNPPVGYWNFNDRGTPTTVADVSSTNSSEMTLLNTESSDWTKGKVGSGLELDGTNEFAYLSNPISSLKPTTTLTVEAWVKADSITHGSPSRPYLVALQTPGSWQDGRGYAFQIDSNGKARFQLGNASGSWKVATGATTLTTGTWYHLVGTYDGSTIKVYVNGKLDGTTSQSMTISYSTSGCGTCRPNPTTLYFGAEHSNAGTGNTDTANMYFFDGVIDEVKIYDYARTSAQVAYDYNRGKPIAHWKLNECQGTTINDASGNGHAGTLTVTASGGNTNGVGTCNTATSAWGSGATGKYGASLNFDGSGDYATITDPNDILDFDSDFSISSWFKTNSSGEQTIINRGQNSDWQYAMFTSLSGTGTGTVTCKVYVQNGGGDYLQATSSQSYVNGSWHQATCTISGTNMYLYVDGKLVGSDTTPTGTRDTASAGEFYIGKFNWSGDYALFNGQIDDFQIYNYALSANQVKKLYNEGSAVRFE